MAAGRRLLAHRFDPLDWALGSWSRSRLLRVSRRLRGSIRNASALGACSTGASGNARAGCHLPTQSGARAGPEMKWRLRNTRGSGLSRPRGAGGDPSRKRSGPFGSCRSEPTATRPPRTCSFRIPGIMCQIFVAPPFPLEADMLCTRAPPHCTENFRNHPSPSLFLHNL